MASISARSHVWRARRRRARGCRAPRAPGTPAGLRAPAPRRAAPRGAPARARGRGRRARSRRCTGRCRPAMRAHQRGLAGAVRAEHRDHLAVVDAQVDLLQHRLGAVARGEPADLEQRRAARRARCAGRALAAPRRDRPCAPPDRAALRPACRAAMRTPASSTTTWSEMPITTDMSCSTSTTAMPASAMRRSSAREPRLVVAPTGRRPARRAAAPTAAWRARARSRPGACRRAAGRRRAHRDRRRSRRTPRGSPSPPAIARFSATLIEPNSCVVW